MSAARSWLYNLLLDAYLKNFESNFLDTGPLWGRGRSTTEGEFLVIENRVLSQWSSWCNALEHAGLNQERRQFILKPNNLQYRELAKNEFELSFDLPKGCYATAILREIAQLYRPQITAL